MLYLFGQLALSDSLFYHEYFADDDCPAYVGSPAPTKPEAVTPPPLGAAVCVVAATSRKPVTGFTVQ